MFERNIRTLRSASPSTPVRLLQEGCSTAYLPALPHRAAPSPSPHREKPEGFALAAHVEHQVLTDVGANTQLHCALLHNVERLGHLSCGCENHRILREVLQCHHARQGANVRRRKELKGWNLFQKSNYRFGDDAARRRLRRHGLSPVSPGF